MYVVPMFVFLFVFKYLINRYLNTRNEEVISLDWFSFFLALIRSDETSNKLLNCIKNAVVESKKDINEVWKDFSKINGSSLNSLLKENLPIVLLFQEFGFYVVRCLVA